MRPSTGRSSGARRPRSLRGEGRVEWQRFDNGVRIWLDDAMADSGHGIARGKVRMLLRPGELPLMDVSATASDFDVTQLWRYLQTGRLSPEGDPLARRRLPRRAA